MRPGPTSVDIPRTRQSRGFTLVEIMVVVVLIGLLAAAALPAYRLITMRSKAASVVNDLRTFSTVFITYNLQNGRWPDNGDPQTVPPQVIGQLPNNFILRTPIGGVYKWHFGGNDGSVAADGLPAKAALIIQADGSNPIIDDLQQLETVDRQIDDGDLGTGNFRLGDTNSLVFIIEK